MRNHGSSSNSGRERHLLRLFQARTVSVTVCSTPAPSPPCWMPRASVTWREVPLLRREWGLPAGTRSTPALQKRYRRDLCPGGCVFPAFPVTVSLPRMLSQLRKVPLRSKATLVPAVLAHLSLICCMTPTVRICSEPSRPLP